MSVKSWFLSTVYWLRPLHYRRQASQTRLWSSALSIESRDCYEDVQFNCTKHCQEAIGSSRSTGYLEGDFGLYFRSVWPLLYKSFSHVFWLINKCEIWSVRIRRQVPRINYFGTYIWLSIERVTKMTIKFLVCMLLRTIDRDCLR